jgi:hypothetical protein
VLHVVRFFRRRRGSPSLAGYLWGWSGDYVVQRSAFPCRARALTPALALGNAVVLKPDPRTAVCGGVVFAGLLEEAGLPADLLHVLPGGGDIGRELVTHPDIPVIAFTGRWQPDARWRGSRRHFSSGCVWSWAATRRWWC